MRFPCYRKATLDLVHSAFFPNGVGQIDVKGLEHPAYTTGVFAGSSGVSSVVCGHSEAGNDQYLKIDFNLSHSNSIFGLSNKVQTRSFQVLMIIKA